MAHGPVLSRLSALELDRAAALHAESFAPLGERAWTRQDVAELLASPGVAGLLLQVDGCDVGFALCRVAADEAELLTIAVRPEARRRGLGRQLLAAVTDRVRAAGARVLFLEVAVDNSAAQSLYASQGFCVVGTRLAYYRRTNLPPADAAIMRLVLE
ncbi:MAG: ribosomal-protein-alanine N-acetyltransferase [Alphaproteobacteria bacterium]|nr:ribosomal-protein-alanine N-acetyltransferase [Alphaproteobacteria bacterium]